MKNINSSSVLIVLNQVMSFSSRANGRTLGRFHKRVLADPQASEFHVFGANELFDECR